MGRTVRARQLRTSQPDCGCMQEERITAMAAIIYKKGPPDNFVWEEIKVGVPERGQVRLRSTAVGVNFADTYHRAGIPHPMIVGEPQGIVPVQTSTLEAAKGRSCASQQNFERECPLWVISGHSVMSERCPLYP